MKYLVQAFTGGFDECHVTAKQLTERIRNVDNQLDVEGVILGWNKNRSLYQAALDELHLRGKKGYLWLPVFSEVSGIIDSMPAIDYNGKSHAPAHVIKGEDFTFVCPSNPINRNNIIRLYREQFDGLGFDGVFLDKIRYSSFGNGFAPAMGCFCENCLLQYKKEGIDLSALKKRMAQSDKSFLIPSDMQKGKYFFADNFINKLFKVRSKIITDSVTKLAKWFHEQGLKVGLDVYAPLFSYYVGQDIEELSHSADFIKPMIYRVTNAPAGIPYEAASMKQKLCANGCKISGALERLWKTSDLCSSESLEFQLAELDGIRCPIYTGFEINPKPNICHTNPAYIHQTVEVLKSAGAEQAVLSWDILSDTQNHLELLARQGGE